MKLGPISPKGDFQILGHFSKSTFRELGPSFTTRPLPWDAPGPMQVSAVHFMDVHLISDFL